MLLKRLIEGVVVSDALKAPVRADMLWNGTA